MQNRMEDGVVMGCYWCKNIWKVKNVEVLYTKKHTSAAAYMIRLTFVYILYSLYIVCMYKKHTKVVSVSLLYKFCIVCTLFVCTKNTKAASVC